MSRPAAPVSLHCEMEYQEGDARSGINLLSTLCPQTMITRRLSGLEIVSDSPVLRKAVKLQTQRYEVYFRFLHQGKITFIRRDSARIYQFNIRHADPTELELVLRFSLRLGAVAKSPMQLLAASTTATARSPDTVHRRRPLSDRSNQSGTTTARSSSPPSSSILSRRRAPSSPSPVRSAPQAKRRRLDSSSSQSKRTRARAVAPSLTRDQQQVIDLIASRQNVFFTGSAGTGKSFLLQQILQPQGPLRSYLQGKRVYATATTGIAAYNIGGMTLHHFAGLDARLASASSSTTTAALLAHIKRKKDALLRWHNVDVLVIDEVSMLDGRLFDLLEELARELRPGSRGLFFGGIQLVLSGDFFQLPPVVARQERDGALLAFECAAWKKGVSRIVELTQVFRQTNAQFVDILNALRVGKPTSAMLTTLNERYEGPGSRQGQSLTDDAIRIFTHNNDVLQTNSKRLDELAGKKFNYISADKGKVEYLSGCPAPPTLSLKKHAQVMLIKTINPTSGLVNGCRGVVTGFTPQTQLPIVRFDNGGTEIVQQEEFPLRMADTVLASRRQLPLALAWAISIHKSQGLAFPSAVLDLSRVFEFGQAYVALSRVRSLEGLRLRTRLDARRLVLADQRVLRFYDGIRSH